MLVSRALGRLLARSQTVSRQRVGAVWLARLQQLSTVLDEAALHAPISTLKLIQPTQRERTAMPLIQPRITPCLWFDSHAEEAAAMYTRIFPASHIGRITRYGRAGFEHHGRSAGSVMTVEFSLDGQLFTALNGGPLFKFNEAVSLMVACKDQAEVDHYWTQLSEGGPVEAQQCGWLKDRFGVSWQIVPHNLVEIMSGADEAAMDRVMSALLEMQKPDLAVLEEALAAG
jgi:predicted 3-demethylubiquinone-9 3-methyltransferase (glyoxalase superfamily)